jgi:two-component system chemotaxis response regulator CheB
MDPKTVIVIASSTGGPQIVRSIFKGLVAPDASIIIVQHMQKFACPHFALNLNKVTKMTVKIAEHGETLESGVAYVAPAGVHLSVKGLTISLVEGRRVNYVCPAADVTMHSMKNCNAAQKVGIVLSGLGEDGARGIEYMKKLNATTIAQAPETCVVGYMPDAAVATGCVDQVLDPEQIRNTIMTMCGAPAHAK